MNKAQAALDSLESVMGVSRNPLSELLAANDFLREHAGIIREALQQYNAVRALELRPPLEQLPALQNEVYKVAFPCEYLDQGCMNVPFKAVRMAYGMNGKKVYWYTWEPA